MSLNVFKVVSVAVSAREFRSIINSFVDELSRDESVASVGLFGGWVKYEAFGSSGIDVIVVDWSGRDYESRELREHRGLVMDVDWVPLSWVGEVVSPEVDHKVHGAMIMHDPGGMLRRAQGFLEANYRSPGRVEMRCEGYLSASEMYLSRITSAVSRGDYETACVFAEMGAASAALVLVDLAGLSPGVGSSVWDLRRACERFGMLDVYRDFMEVGRYRGMDGGEASRVRGCFEDVWGRVLHILGENSYVLGGLHERLRSELGYSADPLMLGLALGRSGEMLWGSDPVGAVSYLRGRLLPLLEGYGWVASAKGGDRFEYTGLFRTLSGLVGGREVYEGALEVFGLSGLDEGVAGGLVDRARRLVSRIRGVRRGLVGRLG